MAQTMIKTVFLDEPDELIKKIGHSTENLLLWGHSKEAKIDLADLFGLTCNHLFIAPKCTEIWLGSPT